MSQSRMSGEGCCACTCVLYTLLGESEAKGGDGEVNLLESAPQRGSVFIPGGQLSVGDVIRITATGRVEGYGEGDPFNLTFKLYLDVEGESGAPALAQFTLKDIDAHMDEGHVGLFTIHFIISCLAAGEGVNQGAVGAGGACSTQGLPGVNDYRSYCAEGLRGRELTTDANLIMALKATVTEEAGNVAVLEQCVIEYLYNADDCACLYAVPSSSAP